MLKLFLIFYFLFNISIIAGIDTLRYNYISVDIKSDDCNKGNEAERCVRFIAEYPLFYGVIENVIIDSINKLFNELNTQSLYTGESSGSIEKAGEEFIKSYIDFINSDEAYYITPWEINKNISVQLNTDKIISFQFTEYSFTGGAHGSYFIGYYNLNRSNGKELNANDIILSSKNSELLKISESIFRKNKEIPEGSSLEDSGYWFENNTFYLPDNFLITNEGLLFVYNPYEIASWAEGVIEIEIPYSLIKDMIIDGSPVKDFLK